MENRYGFNKENFALKKKTKNQKRNNGALKRKSRNKSATYFINVVIKICDEF